MVLAFGLSSSGVSASEEPVVADYTGGETNYTGEFYAPRLRLAQADTTASKVSQADADEVADAPLSPECAAFREDLNADLGAVLKAGCEPTLAQMSALMDNPLGNVAMMFNQFDTYFLENESNGQNEVQHNYMALLQFPKKLNDDWNLINRVVFNVPSVPLDQDKVDDFDGDFSCAPTPGGGPPSCE